MAQVRLEFILFGALLQQPQTGYELQRFMETTGRFMRANTSMTQVYRSLRAMEGRGWLSHEIEPRRGARHAKRYEVTPVGRSTFFGWLRETYQPTELSDEVFFTQARFRAQYLGRDAAIEVADVEITARRRHIARNRDRDRTEWFDPGAPIDVELTSALMEWLHRRGVAWMDRTLAGYIELRELLAAGLLPSDDALMLLQSSSFDDLPTTKETS